MREIEVTVSRYHAEQGQSEQRYLVPVAEKEVVSVMNLLEYIYANLDSTLAFFSHAACKQAACGKCLVKMDGQNVLACKARVEKNSVRLEPYGSEVVRDLICR